MPTLEWANREGAVRAATRAPFRLLEHDPALSCGDPDNENMLIQGDNLEGVKALMPYYAGRVKCIAIDPPYNTRSAFQQYDDNLEHSTWLSMMYPRLELMRDLLSQDGSIWIFCDDNEAHYLKVMGDEIFGRSHFIIDVSWKKRDGAPNDRKLGSIHDHILVWGIARDNDAKKTKAEISFNLMPRTEKADAQYQVFAEPDGPDPRGAFRKIDTTANGKGGRYVESLFYGIKNPYTGEEVWPRKGTCWRHSKSEMERLQADYRLFWGLKGTAKTPMRKLFKHEAKQGMTTPSIWDDVGLNQHGSSEIEAIFGEKAAFETPKPEAVISRIIHIASNPGDIVCDPFLGSGTTAAVAHKMGRRWIGIEMGDHAVTHCAPRLKKVVEGEQGGISEAVSWKGGGGFRFCRIGPAITDEEGRINSAIRFATLAAHVWFSETHTPLKKVNKSPLLGIHKGTAVYLLYNGILGDKKSNTLTGRVLRDLPKHNGQKVIFSECTSLGDDRLQQENVIFKHIPYDIKGR
jgi:adenine-specific DNA-methyltransferase